MASRRKYVTTQEVDELIGSGSSTDLQISEAEEIIDAYVGPQDKFLKHKIDGLASAGGSLSITLQLDQQEVFEKDYFKGCEVEILGGAGEGQRRTITGSTKAGVLTLASALSPVADNTSFYRIYQLGKFPRRCDVVTGQGSPIVYYKQIPEAVKRATAAQVEFMSAMGADFFSGNDSEKTSESIGNYSYSQEAGANGGGGVKKITAPKAKALLRGIINRLGVLEA